MSLTSELEQRVKTSLERDAPTVACGRAVIAVSGGGDSVATAALLFESRVLDVDSSTVAHYDHRLRGEAAAARDLAAVRALCSRYGVRLVTDVWDAPQPSEAAARDARYAFLARVADVHGATAVVTGHHADDQVETVLLHTLRGASLPGLRGMAVEAPLPGDATKRIVRPALFATRDELRAYAVARALEYVDDATNDDTRYARNRVRREVLPLLDTIAPGVRDSILQLARDARDQVAALESIAATAIADPVVGVRTPHVALSRVALAAMPEPVRPYAYRLAVEALLGDARELDRRHYATFARAHAAATGATLEAPRGIMLTVDPNAVIVSVGSLPAAPVPPDLAMPLPWAGIAGEWRVAAVRGNGAGARVRVPSGAVVRGRRPGDIVRLPGGRKKLHDAYIDAKVPRRERDAAPVIAHGRHVLWTPLLCVCHADGDVFSIDAGPASA